MTATIDFDIRAIARALGGDVTNRFAANVPGPGHGRADRSLSLTIKRGRLCVFSHAGDDWKECRDYVMDRLGIGRHASGARPVFAVVSKQEVDDDAKKKSRRAIDIWHGSVDPRGTIVEHYLREHRGLLLPDDIAGKVIRFHASLWFDATTRLPGMICLLRDIKTNEPRAIHRTFLRPDTGEKVDRRMLGPAKGTAIKFDAEISAGLLIGEGGETSLTARQPATDHPLYRLLHDRPNPWTGAVDFVMALESDTIFRGEAFALANRVNGKIIELIRLDPFRVSVDYDEVTHEPSYRLSLKNGGQRTYAWQDILHVRSPDGKSAAVNAAEAIGLSIALERHAAKIAGNGTRPSGIFKSAKKFSDVAYERLKRSWATNSSGENAGGTVILEEGGDFTPLTFNSVDMQFQEQRAFQIIEIGRALGIPPTLLYDFGRATWGNAEEMGRMFRTFTMLGRCKVWEGHHPLQGIVDARRF